MKFTLVIPVAPERGAEIIESIKRLDYPRDEFHVVVSKGKNPSQNRNKGIDKALGEFVVFLDDDASIRENYLKIVERFFERNFEVDVVGGPQLTPLSQKGFGKISGYALSSFFGAWKISQRYGGNKERFDVDETALTSANLICRRRVFKKVRFDENLFPGEDPKFISDAKSEGFNIAYSPNIVVYHKRRGDIGGLVKQIFNYGKTRPLKESFFQTLKMPFFLVPSVFLIYLFLLLILILINPSVTGGVIGIEYTKARFWIFSPLILYIFFAVFFATYDSLSNNSFKSIFVLPFIYPLIHLSYGWGMIYGYILKWKKFF